MRPLAQDALVVESENLAKAAVATDAEKVCVEARDAILNDAPLLAGRVPQAGDWLNSWAYATDTVAFRKQERLSKINGERVSVSRYVRRKQMRIMAKARRQDIRRQLRAATCILISMDDRKDKKIIRYRCDAP